MLVDEQEVEDFLEHFGIPGMRWGYRKQRLQAHLQRLSRISAGTATPQDRAAVRQRRIRSLETAAAIGGTAVAAGGALWLRKYIKDAPKRRISSLLISSQKNMNSAQNISRRIGESWFKGPGGRQLLERTMTDLFKQGRA